MAMEAACKLQVGREKYEGKVRMDGGFIDFAGSTKFRFRLGEIRNPARADDAIQFDFHGNPVSITVGEKAAPRWIDYILHPQTLAEKLGVREGDAVRIISHDDPELIATINTKKASTVGSSSAQCDVIVLGVDRPTDLHAVKGLFERIRAGGALWVIMPKAVRTVTRANVIAAAREAGMELSKSFDYSEAQAAFRITRPAEGNGKKRRANGG